MMRKVISLLLSIAMLITMVSVMATSASADTVSSVIYTFDSNSKPSSWTSDGGNRYKIEIIDLSDSEDETDVTHGNVLKFGTYGDLTNIGFRVPAAMMDVNGIPSKITFDVKAYNSSSTGQIGKSDKPGFALRNSSSKEYYLPQPTSITQSWQTMELSLASYPDIADDYNLTSFVVRKANLGNKIILIDNFTLWYDEYAEVRGEQEPPVAPTVQSSTGTSVTLNAIENAQYSKDGTTWQSSNVFTGLTTNTEYTFYARYRETVDLYASPASAGTTYRTPVVYKWDLYSSNFTLSDNNTGGIFTTAHSSDGTYFEATSNVSVDSHATFTSKVTVSAGVYSTSLYARAYTGRAPLNVDINGTRVASALDTSSKNGTTGTDLEFPMGEVTITETSNVVMTITATATGKIYLNSLKLTKIADYVPEVDPYEDIAGTTSEKAQLRIGNVNGIRFTTTVDTDLIAAAEADGYTVTKGILIAPLSYGELTLDTNPVINLVTEGYFENTEGVIAGSIVNIKPENITREFVARGYVTLTKDQESTTYYTEQPTEGRSLKTLAAACIADTSANAFFDQLNATQQAQVTAWAEAE